MKIKFFGISRLRAAIASSMSRSRIDAAIRAGLRDAAHRAMVLDYRSTTDPSRDCPYCKQRRFQCGCGYSNPNKWPEPSPAADRRERLMQRSRPALDYDGYY